MYVEFEKIGTDDILCKAEIETQTQRTNVDTKGEQRGVGMIWEIEIDIYTLCIVTMYKIDIQLEAVVQHTELYSVLCSDINRKEIKKGGCTCICVADSLCCTAETNTTL